MGHAKYDAHSNSCNFYDVMMKKATTMQTMMMKEDGQLAQEVWE